MLIDPGQFEPGMARQLERLREALADGMPRRGWKIGINVPETLRDLGLSHPGVGWLDGRRVRSAGAELEARPGSRLHVEPEIAIRLSKRVASDCSASAIRECVASVHPALEIVDYAQPSASLDEVVAHCMFHHATVLGPVGSMQDARGLGRELPLLRVAGRPAEPPRADLVPADVGELVAFVARFLAAFGHSLQAGDLVLSGSYLARAVPIQPGEEAIAEFGPLGIVSVKVVADAGAAVERS